MCGFIRYMGVSGLGLRDGLTCFFLLRAPHAFRGTPNTQNHKMYTIIRVLKAIVVGMW